MTIRKLDERSHILLRPAMYVGAVDLTTFNDYVLEGDKIIYRELSYVPALIKIINEIIDNSVDEAIKTDFEFSNEIKVHISETEVRVEDNGRGIPVKKNEDDHYLPELCWAHARSGSNFDDDENRTQIGLNGVGSFATACFSKQFIGETDDGEKGYTIKILNNAETFSEVVRTTKRRGTTVTFSPDLSRFGLEKIDEEHMNVIKQRLLNLSLSFPDITFKFNGKKISTSNFKKYVTLFSEEFESYDGGNYQVAILPNSDDDFRHFSYVNGLKLPEGGSHVDHIMWNIVDRIRNKLVKKYKTIKPGDIRNKLMMVSFCKDFKNTKFNSQSKEKLTNSSAEVTSYLGDINYDALAYKIMRNPAIMDPIVEVYKIKEELKRRQELKSLEKPTKKFKSDKYLPPIGDKKYLVLTEGQSAAGGLIPALGRKDFGYYILRGVPLNAYSADTKKFTSNVELSELYKIVQNEGYENIIIASDMDLDGIHIRGLLIGFFQRYLPEFKLQLGCLKTPIIAVKKNKELKRWYYNLNDDIEVKSGEQHKFYKGLGSWDAQELKHIMDIDGLDQMLDMFDFDSEEMIHNWLSPDCADTRKGYIMENEFNIAKI